jgi:Raf kinase inhibitor-like YbhB/YbcL family protein
MSLRSSAFDDGEPIPARYTCEDRDVSPPLAWSGVPTSARSLALVVDDPDAPDPAAPQGTWVHWVLYNLPPTITSLADGIGASFQQGARAGRNDFGRVRYNGPCPPVGRHRYFFKLYALDTVLPELNKPSADVLQRAMAGHIVGQATLVGTYRKSR